MPWVRSRWGSRNALAHSSRGLRTERTSDDGVSTEVVLRVIVGCASPALHRVAGGALPAQVAKCQYHDMCWNRAARLSVRGKPSTATGLRGLSRRLSSPARAAAVKYTRLPGICGKNYRTLAPFAVCTLDLYPADTPRTTNTPRAQAHIVAPPLRALLGR